MKMVANFLCVFSLFLFSCSNSDAEPVDSIELKTVGIKITPNNSVEIDLLDDIESKIYFEIITLSEETYASRINTANNSVQILDNSTFRYPDALELNEVINEDQNWSLETSFVLGTSVGNAGLFEGSGLRYLGFRILNNAEYQYGWISIINNQGNDCVEIESYAINLTSGQSILAGQTK